MDKKNEIIYAEKIFDSKIYKNIMSVYRTIIPFGDLIDTNINEIVNDFMKKKHEEFLSEILKSNLSMVDVKDVEFIMNFKKTLDAVNRLSNNDKVKYFANLLKNSYMNDIKILNDEYEEMLRILGNMSYREINYLLFLYKFEQENDLTKDVYWYSFMAAFEKKFEINRYKSYEIYKRLGNTGLICEELKLESKTVTEHSNNEEYNELLTDTLDLKYFYTTDLLKKMVNLISE